MNWPSIRNFPASAKVLIAIYTMLMGSILVVALILSSWHHGLMTDKSIERKGVAGNAAPTAVDPSAAMKAAQKADDGQSSGVVIEADSEAVKVTAVDWFIYENFKLGHTHLNGQTLVYFSLMILFLWSSASERMKILWGILLAFSVVLHTFGLFFMHKDLFAMMLRASGGLLSLSITVMCVYVFVDTLRRPATQ